MGDWVCTRAQGAAACLEETLNRKHRVMVRLTFLEHDGKAHVVEAVEGETLMRAALDNNVPGIVGECGGELACATCHCYLDTALSEAIEPIGNDETAMLEGALDVTRESRLSCQVLISKRMEGATVRLPLSQT